MPYPFCHIEEFCLTNSISFSWKSGLEHMVWRVVDVCSSVEVLFMNGKQMNWCESLWFHCPITERGVYTIDESNTCVWELSNMSDSITIHHDRVQASVSDGTWRMGAAKPTQRGCVYPCGSGLSRRIWALLLIPLASILWFGWGLPSCVSFCLARTIVWPKHHNMLMIWELIPYKPNKTCTDFIPSLQTLHLCPTVTVFLTKKHKLNSTILDL